MTTFTKKNTLTKKINKVQFTNNLLLLNDKIKETKV